MTEISIAHKYANPECAICEGSGIVQAGPEDIDYCLCVKTFLNEKEGEKENE